MAGLNGEGHAPASESVHVAETPAKPALNIDDDAQELIAQKFAHEFPVVCELICKYYPGTTHIFVEVYQEPEIGARPDLVVQLVSPLDFDEFRSAGHALMKELRERDMSIYMPLAVIRR